MEMHEQWGKKNSTLLQVTIFLHTVNKPFVDILSWNWGDFIMVALSLHC